MIIYAPINQSFEKIINPTLTSLFLTKDDTLLVPINFTTPIETTGNLFCSIFIDSSQNTDNFYASCYTTQVNTITFSEILTNYNLVYSDYQKYLDLYTAKSNEFDTKSGDYNTLDAKYKSELAEHTLLLNKYNLLNSSSNDLQGNLTLLQADYFSLNETYTNLQNEINTLQRDYDVSQETITTDRILMTLFIIILVSLIVLIIYLRNKQKEPYVVIRKETVSMKPKKK
jgi:hypothetical protein